MEFIVPITWDSFAEVGTLFEMKCLVLFDIHCSAPFFTVPFFTVPFIRTPFLDETAVAHFVTGKKEFRKKCTNFLKAPACSPIPP